MRVRPTYIIILLKPYVKLYKHVTKHPKKYIAGATGVAGIGVYSEHQKQKKMGTHARLKKELKRKGFI